MGDVDTYLQLSVDFVSLCRLWVLPAAHKVGLGVEGCHEAVAMTPEVIGHKIFVDFASETKDAVAGPPSACVHMGYHKNT